MAEVVNENKKVAVERIASSVKLDGAEVEKVLDAFVLEAVTPMIFRAGGEVMPMWNDCDNDCKAAAEESRKAIGK